MSDLITGITSALDIAKKLRDLNKKVGEAEYKMLLADLTSELGDAKLEAANMKIELAEVRAKNSELEAALSRRADSEPELHEHAYVFGDNTRHYCTACYDRSGKKSLLTENMPPFNAFGKWMCPVCQTHLGPGRL